MKKRKITPKFDRNKRAKKNQQREEKVARSPSPSSSGLAISTSYNADVQFFFFFALFFCLFVLPLWNVKCITKIYE